MVKILKNLFIKKITTRKKNGKYEKESSQKKENTRMKKLKNLKNLVIKKNITRKKNGNNEKGSSQK